MASRLLLLLPPPPPHVGVLAATSPFASASPSPCHKSSLAIISVIAIATITATSTISLLCRSCRQRPFPRATPPPSTELDLWPVDSPSAVPPASTPAPSAPPLPEVEKVILALLELSGASAAAKSARSRTCSYCNAELFPGDELRLPACGHAFHQWCIIQWLRETTVPGCPFCRAPVMLPFSAPAPPGGKVLEAVGSSRGWLATSLATFSGRWSGCSSGRATVVPVSSRLSSGSWRRGSNGWLGGASWSGRWDLEAAVPTPDRPPGFQYIRWLFGS